MPSTHVRAHQRVTKRGKPTGVRAHTRRTPTRLFTKKQAWKVKYTLAKDYLKLSEGGVDVKMATTLLNRLPGVYAKREYSPYIGHEQLHIHTRDTKSMEKALRELMDYGFIHSVAEERPYITKN